MSESILTQGLNPPQKQAVTATEQNQLVLAGAGSGKTRVLVHRIAWLLETGQSSSFSIMAVTFTNKAAKEIRGRVDQLLGGHHLGMWLGTFHGIAHRLLRAHYQEAGLPEAFQILDSDDQYRILRRLLKAMNLDEKKWPPKQIQHYINRKKDEGLRPAHIQPYGNPVEQTWLKVYQAYQEQCDRAGLVDFAELLLRAHELWLNHPELLQHYRERFSHILIDEFQDTNRIQYAWLRMLAGDELSVMIVGDDDQSIYGWRGAEVENIQRFIDDFHDVKTIRLEQNYRSTNTILKAANALIANNKERLGKELWSEAEQGEAISVYTAFNETDEARFVVDQIKSAHLKGRPLSDCAMLYRNNAQSRVLEEALLQASLPYRIYGGLRFFERQEIKDALAYLRLIQNRNDDAAFERVVNTPTRGIGDKSLSLVRDCARDEGCSLWQAALTLLDRQSLKGRAASCIGGFIQLVSDLEQQNSELPLHEQVDQVIWQSGLKAMYLAEKGEKAKARVENLEELVTACREYLSQYETDSEMSPLAAFLSHAALEAGEQQADEFEDAVQLMTLHSAKGLEFPLVFITGVEEGMFPSQSSAEDFARLEEERRLCYVGMTRAMEKLYLCHAENRRIYGREQYARPSRFLKELPSEFAEPVRLKTQVRRPSSSGYAPSGFSKQAYSPKMAMDSPDSGFNLGQQVMHPKFGEGTILNFEGSGGKTRVQVRFEREGTKWLVLQYARLEAV
ncbi:DNA helicase II [Dongshaea marina]|uniref:DNA helicase II n=1 Tax=Dongshaea marina TaxID=2047966 RepID=UPI000D3E9FF3|nr:DNA helicase II [Dongshaea marina]